MQTAAGAAVPKRQEANTVTVSAKKDPEHKMKCVQWFGSQDVRVVDSDKPMLTDPKDVVLRVTSMAICGSDLHMFVGSLPGMKKNDIMGHEFMGIVEEVGPEVRSLTQGDRVVVACHVSCGTCYYCKKELYSSCENTNPSKEQEELYGHHTAGFFGYSHLTGGYEGGQAEFVRVPFADVMCLKVPSNLSDDQVLLLSDVLPTAYHGLEMGEVSSGDTVAIWGCGPVGMMTAMLAQERGAARVVLIDSEEYRLDFAKEKLPGVEIINFKDKKPYDAFQDMFKDDAGNYIGPDVAIEAVGFHYTNSWLHYFETALKLETDPSDIINELIRCVRKGGRIAILGVYAGYCNHFNIGAFMEKQLTMRGGQVLVQKYWKDLLKKIQDKKIDPTFVITHHLALDDAAKGYMIFNEKKDGCLKVVMKPSAAAAASAAGIKEE